LRIIGGTAKDLQPWQKKNLPAQRDPVPHNGAARDMFASDLLAVSSGQLSHPHEEKEKMLLRIGESLSLRGPEIDQLNEAALADEREKIVNKSLKDVKGMTLSVIDGNFPREVLANQNLAFTTYRMPARRNGAKFYDAKTKRPTTPQQGMRFEGALSFDDEKDVDAGRKLSRRDRSRIRKNSAAGETDGRILTNSATATGLGTMLSLTLVGLVWLRRRNGKRSVRSQ
jgi:hypothetical protein